MTKPWVQFHSYWSNQFKRNDRSRTRTTDDYYRVDEDDDETTNTTPQIILHYENLSNKAIAPTTMRTLLTFLNETESKTDRTLEEKVRAIIREPTYEYGTLLVKSCGIDVARNVHELSKHITKELGYHFDHERGTWSLEVGTTSIVLQ